MTIDVGAFNFCQSKHDKFYLNKFHSYSDGPRTKSHTVIVRYILIYNIMYESSLSILFQKRLEMTWQIDTQFKLGWKLNKTSKTTHPYTNDVHISN